MHTICLSDAPARKQIYNYLFKNILDCNFAQRFVVGRGKKKLLITYNVGLALYTRMEVSNIRQVARYYI